VSRRGEVAAAGHTGDEVVARAALADPDPTVRATAIGALERSGALTTADLHTALADPDATVRTRAAEAAHALADVDLAPVLEDDNWQVVEKACWSAGERAGADDAVLARLDHLARHHPEALVRESAVAALGAIGDPRGLPAILAATRDRPAVRRRAAIALAPFEQPEALDALRHFLDDRDWQTRQVAEDLLGVRGR
jgi:HEAT repeat protein